MLWNWNVKRKWRINVNFYFILFLGEYLDCWGTEYRHNKLGRGRKCMWVIWNQELMSCRTTTISLRRRYLLWWTRTRCFAKCWSTQGLKLMTITDESRSFFCNPLCNNMIISFFFDFVMNVNYPFFCVILVWFIYTNIVQITFSLSITLWHYLQYFWIS